jgi:Flp pilus assembly pilin Flp
MIARTIAKLRRDTRGATAIEFAAIAPALLMVLLGLMDLSYNLYATTLLEGAVQEAGRNSTIEGAEGKGMAIDNKVGEVVHDIVPDAAISFSRRAYIDYADVGRPEDFTDSNGDNFCNDGEPFEDVNANGVWDQDRAKADMGGARDAVLYTVTASYPRAFPLMKWFGFSDTVTARSRTVLRNQPYGTQNKAAPVGNCE